MSAQVSPFDLDATFFDLKRTADQAGTPLPGNLICVCIAIDRFVPDEGHLCLELVVTSTDNPLTHLLFTDTATRLSQNPGN